MAPARISLRFGTPHHGWLDVALVHRDEQSGRLDTHAIDVSDVPCDSLAQLADAACSLLEGRDEARVDWSLEPAFDVWLFRLTEPDCVELRIGTESSREAPKLFAVSSASELATAFWRGMRRLESDPIWHDTRALEAWSSAFPTEKLAALGHKLERRSGFRTQDFAGLASLARSDDDGYDPWKSPTGGSRIR